MAPLFASVGLTSIGYIATVTVSSLIAEDLLGTAVFSGVPNAVATLGRAAGTILLSAVMLRHGRRAGLILGTGLSAAAVVVAGGATVLGSFPLFLFGLAVFGLGYGGTQLARYAAADLYPGELRSSAIGWIVWAGTIGSVLGPALLAPSQMFAESFGLPGLTGAHMVGFLSLVMAGSVLWAMVGPEDFPSPAGSPSRPDSSTPKPREWLGSPRVRIAILMLVVGQSSMILLMAMTPIYIRSAGKGLGSIGVAMSAHTLGMFALSPVSGWFSDRFGRLAAISTASALLVAAAALAYSAAGDQVALLSVSIFLLGLGWNLGFVAGSALLTESVPPADQIRAQGIADSLAWVTGAVAGVASGVLLAAWGFPALSVIGGGLALLPLLAVARFLFKSTARG